jgi:phospho-N-acetylmuramoyl-pentapeptide-transferase
MFSITTGFICSFAVGVLCGQPIIWVLKRMGARQTVSQDAPGRHQAKQGTPTMGGLILLAGLLATMLIEALANPAHQQALGLVALTLAFGVIGFVDDFLIATRGKNLGLKARQKLALQILFACLFVLWLHLNEIPGRTTVIRWRLDAQIDLQGWYYLLGVLFIVGMSNAINLTDGLDGLAGGIAAILALALVGTVYSGDGFGWLPLFGAALAGACAGFLWFNAHPAQVFMGDTGSLALGAALAGMAMLGKMEAHYQFFAAVPWAETLSVMIQVLVFKARRRKRGLEYAQTHRVFRRTPLHHHFEELGWPETRIVQRFWLATLMAVAVGLWLLRYSP